MEKSKDSLCCEEDQKDDPPSFEDVIEELGSTGIFQIVQIAFCYSSMVLTSFVILSFVVLGYEPPHVCNAVNETQLLSQYGLQNSSASHIFYQTCEIQISRNESGEMVQVDSVACPNGHNFSHPEHTTYISEWGLVCGSSGVAELSQTLYNIGQIIGGFAGSAIADRFGRKPVFVIASFFTSVVEFCIVAAPSIFVVYGLKLISGIFYQALACVFFVYAMEFVTPKQREINGSIMCFLWVIDTMLVGGVGYFFRNHDWKYFQGAVGVSGLLFILYPFFMYESPRWLAANDKQEDALRVLKIASERNGTDFQRVKEKFNAYVTHTFPSSKHHVPLTASNAETLDLDGENVIVKGEREPRPTMLSLLRNKSLRKPALICWYVFTTNVLTYFGLYMTSSDLAGDRFLNFSLMNIAELPCTLLMFLMLKKMSRRLVLEIAMSLTAVSLIVSGLLVTITDGSEPTASLNTTFFIFGKFWISISFNVVYMVVPEVFPTNLRSTATGFCSGFARIGAMLAPFMRPLFKIAKWAPGLIFSVMCIIAVVLVMLLPETKDEKLPDTVDGFGKPSNNAKCSAVTREE